MIRIMLIMLIRINNKKGDTKMIKKHVREQEKRKRENPKEKKITKRLPTGPAQEQKIILNDKSEIKFYNPDFRREIF